MQNASRAARGLVQGSSYTEGPVYKKADLHLHSNFSYDVLNLPELSPRALYDKAVARGMGFFVLTDHDTIKGFEALQRELGREYGAHPPIPVIPGVEIKVRDPNIGHTIHVNVLGLNRRHMARLVRMRNCMPHILQYCRAEGLYHAYNHPFWFERGERGKLAVISRLIDQFPVVELNAGRIPQLNRRTFDLARRYGREVVAASDSHTGQIGKAFTMAPGDTAEEFLRNLQAGVSVSVPHTLNFREFMREIRETIDLVFVKQSAFKPKASFLKQTPIARRIARAMLRSETLMRPRRLKTGVKAAMITMSYAPAYAFILNQRRMHWSLGDMI